MTKALIGEFGCVYIVLLLDWYTKKIVGHYVGLQSRTWQWFIALKRAVDRQLP